MDISQLYHSPFPALRVEGRCDDMLYVQAPDGKIVPLLPLALVSLLEETPAVSRFQIIQVDSVTLKIRLETEAGADRMHIWEKLHRRLRGYLVEQGVPLVNMELDAVEPQRDLVGGKFRQVWVNPS